MLILVIGGAASGKSEFAENLCIRLSGENKRLYVATMEPFGEEAEYRIGRHREMRVAKKFDTLEKYRNLNECSVLGYHTVLVECMSTLLANEFFTDENYYSHIVDGIACLHSSSTNLTVITNKIFSDGIIYDDQTMAYIKALGEINRYLGNKADAVIEVICGIPVILKGEGIIREYC